MGGTLAMPPPSPPPPKAKINDAQESNQESSDSSLSDGEVAGVAIGASIGGIVLLGAVGLILRSIMFKEAKPVFTCLEKAPAKSPAYPSPCTSTGTCSHMLHSSSACQVKRRRRMSHREGLRTLRLRPGACLSYAAYSCMSFQVSL